MTFDLITADAMGSGFADHWCSVNDGVSVLSLWNSLSSF